MESSLAQLAQAGAQAPSLFVQLVPILLIFGIFYFLLLAPMRKRTALSSVRPRIRASRVPTAEVIAIACSANARPRSLGCRRVPERSSNSTPTEASRPRTLFETACCVSPNWVAAPEMLPACTAAMKWRSWFISMPQC